MPIKPENAKLYGTREEWRAIVALVRKRSEDRCEWPGCELRNGLEGIRFADGTFDAARLPDEVSDFPGSRWVRIVLTTAHLDHNPENMDLSNLRHWCQMHHLRYDAKHHAETAKCTREKAKGPLLFEVLDPSGKTK